MLRLLVLAVSLAILAAVGGFLHVQELLREPIAVDTTVDVKPGATLAGVAAELAGRGVIRHAELMSWYGRLTEQAHRIKAGEYPIRAGDTIATLVERMVRGEALTYELTFIEGWTFKQFRTLLAAQPKLEQRSLGWSDERLMSELGLAGQHPEGRFFPDTYVYRSGDSDIDILRRANTALRARLAEVWAGRDKGLPYESEYDALIMASIVEKETGAAGERARIAGVFVRRLRKNMLLQTDPTVIYGMGDRFDGDIRRKDLREDTAYNTYVRKGLPPTPIANPGAAALHAAVHPQDGTALFFVARGDGSHQFSDTYAEHKRAVRQYQLKQRNSGG